MTNKKKFEAGFPFMFPGTEEIVIAQHSILNSYRIVDCFNHRFGKAVIVSLEHIHLYFLAEGLELLDMGKITFDALIFTSIKTKEVTNGL